MIAPHIRVDSPGACQFIRKSLGIDITDAITGLIVVKDDQVLGAAVLGGGFEGNGNLTAAGHVWNVSVIREIARHCFAHVRAIRTKTSEHNEPAIKALKKMGFKQEAVLRDWFADGAAISFGLLRDEQKLVRL